MAPPKKKRAEDYQQEEMEDEDLESDDDDEEEDNNEHLGQILNVEFEAVAPSADDYPGIQLLLQQKFSKYHVNVGHLTELIIKQEDVGCVLKQDDDDESDDDDSPPIALFSVINLMEKKNEESVKQIRTLISAQCQTAAPELAGNVVELLHSDAEPLGFLISERFLGVPPRICVPSLQSLKQDMEKQNQAGKPFKFAYYLMLCQTLRDTKNAETRYRFPEEKLFEHVSDISVTWSMAEQRDTVKMEGREFEPCLTMVIFKADKLDSIINKIETDKDLLEQL